MTKHLPLAFVAFFALGAVLGAAFDTPIMRLIRPPEPAISYAYQERLERLERFPPLGSIAFFGDSHVERGDWNAIFQRHDIANYGISGDGAAGVLARLPTRFNGEQALVLIGTNDLAAHKSPHEIATLIGQILAKLAPAPVVLISVLPTFTEYQDRNGESQELNGLLEETCDLGCQFADAFSALTVEGQLGTAYSNDGLHLNADGYETLASVLKPLLIAETTSGG